MAHTIAVSAIEEKLKLGRFYSMSDLNVAIWLFFTRSGIHSRSIHNVLRLFYIFYERYVERAHFTGFRGIHRFAYVSSQP